jgi:hypothetical protein
MSRPLSVLVATVVVAAALLAAATPARADYTLYPSLPPIPGELVCLTCAPDLITSVELRYSWGIPYRVVSIKNVGGPAANSSTASVTWGNNLPPFVTSVSVPPLAAGETRVVYRVLAAVLIWGACADTLGDVSESSETNNCA